MMSSSRKKPVPGPQLACEIFSDRVVAARASVDRGALEVHTSRALAPGTVAPGLTTSNIGDPASLSASVADALNAVAARSRDVVAIIPDSAVRVALLDFDSLPEVREEALGVIRFRLKKSMPFDVDKARVSYHAARNGALVKVVACVALAETIEGYEQAFLQAGYAPGTLVPSTLAALGVVEAERPSLIVKISHAAVTIAIVDEHELRLFRTLEGAEQDLSRLGDAVYPSLVFFEDQFGARIERVLVAGNATAKDLAASLAVHTSAPVEDLVDSQYLTGSLTGDTRRSGELAGVIGALLQ